MKEFRFLALTQAAAEQFEECAEMAGAARINQDGWGVDYEGTGIVFWVESLLSKREWKLIISMIDGVELF